MRERDGNDQHPAGIEVFEKSSTDLSDQDTRSADWSSRNNQIFLSGFAAVHLLLLLAPCAPPTAGKLLTMIQL